MPHTSSLERLMLTTITGLIGQAKGCEIICTCGLTEVVTCPLMGVLLAIKKSLEIEVIKNLGENDRNQRP